ncbi:uncharacterized protein F5147DRAFT_658803 [Suillus discolor]|uniref:Uncharacterized protein n=1 Tax=Suillus discolor TaxID=1912936 RepID=A0A9P7JMD4_9AGAM|nr:uncharacterized protein F5147DRAFT_658803 [Suillus discolor]KAG2088086.1 hypothetical protein F5147DRAFT_658803 [Suillus discolor]
MAPHIHIPSCKSTAGRANTHTSTHTNAEKALDVFTGSYDTVRVWPDIQIHPADIARFVQVGFDDQINSFATRSGFQPTVIQDIYKNVSSYKDTQKVVRAMHIAAMESAKVEIQQLRNQRLPERAKAEMEPKEEEDSDSEDLYERPEKAKAKTEPKEEEND